MDLVKPPEDLMVRLHALLNLGILHPLVEHLDVIIHLQRSLPLDLLEFKMEH